MTMEVDVIFKLDRPLNESRAFGTDTSLTGMTDYGPNGRVGIWDPKLWTNVEFGRQIARQLNSIGQNYSAEVTDMGHIVIISVKYHNLANG